MGYDMNQLLEVCLQLNASDLHISFGRPPTYRIHGAVKPMRSAELNADDCVALMKQITSERGQQELATDGTTDFAISYQDKARFRVSAFKQKGKVSLVLRLIPSKLLSFEDIGLPNHVKDLCLRPRGLVLVTGPTGCGKSTTLATMIDFINQEEDGHIITIEDPIEFYHEHKRSVVNQREVHVDLPTFADGIRRALREDPDVILVGEMRDLETVGAAITAAETGHLVFATLHTTGASRTVDRIIDAFPTNQQEMVRTQLAGNLIAVVSQALLPKKNGKGRVAAFEIMIMNPAISNLIRENKSFRIDGTIQTSQNQGMILLDEYLFKLYQQDAITFDVMMEYAKDVGYLQRRVQEAGLAPVAASAGG